MPRDRTSAGLKMPEEAAKEILFREHSIAG